MTGRVVGISDGDTLTVPGRKTPGQSEAGRHRRARTQAGVRDPVPPVARRALLQQGGPARDRWDGSKRADDCDGSLRRHRCKRGAGASGNGCSSGMPARIRRSTPSRTRRGPRGAACGAIRSPWRRGSGGGMGEARAVEMICNSRNWTWQAAPTPVRRLYGLPIRGMEIGILPGGKCVEPVRFVTTQ